MPIERFPSQSPFAAEIGFSAAVRAGEWVFGAGLTAVTSDGALVGGGDAYEQAVEVMEKLEQALLEAGARLDQVVKTTVYVTEAGDWNAVGRAHAEAFGESRPAATMLVTGLLDPRMLVELEALAYLGD